MQRRAHSRAARSRHTASHTSGVLAALQVASLILCLTTGCVPSVPLWPEVALATSEPQPLRIGAAAKTITPDAPVFLAGGIPFRPALCVHDDIWARAIAFDDGTHCIALVALDLIGVHYDDVVRIRRDIAQRVELDYALIAATHTHNAPDLLDYWSPLPLYGDDRYRRLVGQRVAEAVAEAVARLRPARLRVVSGNAGDPPLSRDTRPPAFVDDTLTVWQAQDADTGELIVTSVHFGVHPILVPSLNFDISSDFVHYLRNALEGGMDGDDGPVTGLGGLCVFFNGAIAGRITPANTEPLTLNRTADPAYQRAQAYGYRLARRVQHLLSSSSGSFEEATALSVQTRQVRVPLMNPLLRAGTSLCLIDRASPGGHVNSEVGIVRIGPLELFAVPGMIFPDQVHGRAASLPNRDFPHVPPESPPLANLACTEHFVVVGLANDLLGYIIPKGQWDARPPFTTGTHFPPYGEIVSPGPDTAAIITDALASLRP